MSLSKFVQFVSATDGSDKAAKIFGYGFSVLGYAVEKLDTKGGNSQTALGLKALGSQISMARYVTRLTGLLESLEALHNDSWAYVDDTDHIKSIVKWQAYSMVLYYPLEHASWLGWSAGPRFIPSLNPDKYSRHSCVLWTLYVLLNIYANYIRYRNCEAQLKLLNKNGNLTKINRLRKQYVIFYSTQFKSIVLERESLRTIS